MTGMWLLVAAQLRRDRWLLVLWALVFALLWGAVGAGLSSAFTEELRVQLVALLSANPALLLLRGAPAGTSFPAVMVVSTYSYIGVMIGLMMTFLAVRHVRGDEDAGRAELIRSTIIGRLAPVAATAVTGALQTVLVAVVVLACSLLIGMPGEGSMLVALGIVGMGWTYLLIGLLAAQAMPTSRAANGAAAAVVGATFLLRGVGDAFGEVSDDLTRVESGLPSWLSPIGWATQTHPFVDQVWTPSWMPLSLFALAVPVLLVLVVVVESRRELGASLVQARAGRASAPVLLQSPLGLAARLHRGAVLGWVIAAVVIGQVVGRVAPSVADSLGGDAQLMQLVSAVSGGVANAGSIIDTFVVALTSIVGVLAAAAAMQGALRIRSEELAHGETVLATARSRTAWFGSMLAVALVAGLVVMLAFTVSASVGLAVGGHDRTETVVQAAAALLPVVVVYLALGALLAAVLPATVRWLGWVLLFGLMMLGQFAPLFGEDWDWIGNASPFEHVANVLDADPDWGPSLWMLGAALAAVAVSLVVLRRRDVTV